MNPQSIACLNGNQIMATSRGDVINPGPGYHHVISSTGVDHVVTVHIEIQVLATDELGVFL